ncbi:hypothetical protein E4U13_007741 [Claviceps humidiphila]|uniref:Uncharacterized protein n=1 Tax=Claviceps humidiphila TaxID=1294629 RepID=A0A9P7Q8B7_9HYPO|nr:hypothetical protein E4U13_007741 [Claviceps humidiphila]
MVVGEESNRDMVRGAVIGNCPAHHKSRVQTKHDDETRPRERTQLLKLRARPCHAGLVRVGVESGGTSLSDLSDLTNEETGTNKNPNKAAGLCPEVSWRQSISARFLSAAQPRVAALHEPCLHEFGMTNMPMMTFGNRGQCVARAPPTLSEFSDLSSTSPTRVTLSRVKTALGRPD